MKVVILDKQEGKSWSDKEISALEREKTEFEMWRVLPHRIVVAIKPLSGRSFQEIFGHGNFRWIIKNDGHNRPEKP
ncbi:MAG TPA: hypothetical protein P5080_05985 [Candidatus Paceibacterota bacterium]|nr:hypothetical protein [Candidatus Pacearchaeota archaeon]HRZ51481.1 hypothetical protein [Candidatus Paceibacterota bacterium]HSA37217.1 hypothetical protein [Candidatus Paceibacterota bacterium]